MLYDDESAWRAWPKYRIWYDKLWLSDRLGYKCGPGCVDIPKPGYYMVRPITNLYGLGAGAKIQYLSDGYSVPPGYFWCEVFEGEHVTQDLKWQGEWKPTRTLVGDKVDHSRFARWRREDRAIPLPGWFDELAEVGHINIESIGRNIIEVHLRLNPDPDHSELIPVHADDLPVPPSDEYRWFPDQDNGDGFAPNHRLGFWYKD